VKPLDLIKINVNAVDADGEPGVATREFPGVLVFISKATAGFSMRFDAGEVFPTNQGFKFNDASSPFNKLTFFNFNSFPINLELYIGQIGVDYVGPSEIKPAATEPLGNFGIAVADDIAKVFGQKVSTITIANPGTGYKTGDILTTPDGTGTKARFFVASVSSGGIIGSINIIDGGNYSVLPATPSTVIGGTGSGAQLNLNFTSLTGAVLGVSGNWLTITSAASLEISNGSETNLRKCINFKVKTGSAVGLLVQDADGNTLRELAASEEITIETSGVVQIIAAATGTATFSVYELPYL
jgi:hypothetical protein